MKASLRCSVLLLLVMTGAQAAECVAPAAINVPKGATATKEEMQATSRAIKAADADVKVYGTCLMAMRDAEYDKLGRDLSDGKRNEIHARFSKLENDAIDALKKTAADYNGAVKAWNKAHPKPAQPAK